MTVLGKDICFKQYMQLVETDKLQRLAHKDLDNWEQKRVERLKGENDGVL